MSLDKFGRSNASITRRPLPLVPSRRLLLGAGVLCRTGDYVDFKAAFARNLSTPVHEKDATTKEYVDECVKSVKVAVGQSVKDSREAIINSIFNRLTDFLNSQHNSLKDALETFITSEVKRLVLENSIQFTRDLNETKGLLETRKKDAKAFATKTNTDLTKLNADLTVLKGRVNKQQKDSGRFGVSLKNILERIHKLELANDRKLAQTKIK